MALLAPISHGFLEDDGGAPGLYVTEAGVVVIRSAQGGPLVPVGGGGGGGFVIGSSVLWLTVESQPGLPPNANADLLFSEDELIGTDLSLDVDTKTIHILTDGWYQAYVHVLFSGAMDDFQVGINTPSAPAPDSYLRGGASGGLDVVLAFPPLPFTAGQDISFYIFADVNPSAGTWSVAHGSRDASIVRLS